MHGDHRWRASVLERDPELRRGPSITSRNFPDLNTSWGKKLSENKMPELRTTSSRFLQELFGMHRRHQARADRTAQSHGLPRRLFRLRPETDGANFLGAASRSSSALIQQDIDYIKEFTDLPLLIRTDTLQYLDPRDVVADLQEVPGFLAPHHRAPNGTHQSVGPEQIRTARRHDGLEWRRDKPFLCTGEMVSGGALVASTSRRAALTPGNLTGPTHQVAQRP